MKQIETAGLAKIFSFFVWIIKAICTEKKQKISVLSFASGDWT